MNNIIKIEDFNDPNLDVYARLTENQLLNRANPLDGIFIAESPKVVERALDSGAVPISFLMEEKHVLTQAKHLLERCDNVPVYVASFDVLTKLTGFALTRGVLCAMRRPRVLTLDEVCVGARRIAILDEIMNPTNVGAIFRNAAALGIDAVLITKACANPLYRRAIRVSMGTVFQIPWGFATDNYIERLHSKGFKVLAMALKEDSYSIDNPQIVNEQKLAIILGNEGEGLAQETIAKCDYTVMIPMNNGVDSLNVAAASALAFWELAR